MFVFNPAISREGSLYFLPRPVTAVRLQDSWDYMQLKVPLCDGDFLAGSSRGGVDLYLEGQIGSGNGTLRLSESEMFSEIEAFREQLGGEADPPFEFFLYHDVATATYRSLRECRTTRFEYDLSHPALFTYSLVVHASDPALHASAPA